MAVQQNILHATQEVGGFTDEEAMEEAQAVRLAQWLVNRRLEADIDYTGCIS